MPVPRPIFSTTAIVIGRTNFGEADRVVRFLTPDRGKLSGVAKGVRKIKSRFGGHLELFGEVSLMCASGRSLDTITSVRVLWYPHQLVGDYTRLELAFLFAKAVDRLVEPGQPAQAVYQLVRESLTALDEGASGALIELWFKLQLLVALGYHPELGACITCGEHDPSIDYTFSAEKGGIFCHRDSSPIDAPISAAEIKFWRMLCKYPYKTISHINGADIHSSATLSLCDGFYEHHLNQVFRAKQV